MNLITFILIWFITTVLTLNLAKEEDLARPYYLTSVNIILPGFGFFYCLFLVFILVPQARDEYARRGETRIKNTFIDKYTLDKTVERDL